MLVICLKILWLCNVSSHIQQTRFVVTYLLRWSWLPPHFVNLLLFTSICHFVRKLNRKPLDGTLLYSLHYFYYHSYIHTYRYIQRNLLLRFYCLNSSTRVDLSVGSAFLAFVQRNCFRRFLSLYEITFKLGNCIYTILYIFQWLQPTCPTFFLLRINIIIINIYVRSSIQIK